jgi:large subunit ribosomal protein L25
MSQAITVEAEPREDFGKNSARRTRVGGRIPGIVYGGGGPVIPISVDPIGIRNILRSESGHNSIFTLNVRGKAPARAMIREWQAEPIRGGLLHVDLVRIALDHKLKLKIAIHITGEPKGVKLDGGLLEFMLREVEVECLPDDIPESLNVDISGLGLGQSVRVSELQVGSKVKILTEAKSVVAHVVSPKAEEEKPAEVAEATPAEPEVIRKGKTDEEGAEEEGGADKKDKAEKKDKSK